MEKVQAHKNYLKQSSWGGGSPSTPSGSLSLTKNLIYLPPFQLMAPCDKVLRLNALKAPNFRIYEHRRKAMQKNSQLALTSY